MKHREKYDVRPPWLAAITQPQSIRYLAFILMFAGIGSAIIYTRAATAARPITGFGGQCLSAGSPVQIRPCDGGANQAWDFDQDGPLKQAGKCLDIERNQGVAVRLAECDNSKYQRWHQDESGALLNLANASCLQPAIGGEAGGPQGVITGACTAGATQRWDTGR